MKKSVLIATAVLALSACNKTSETTVEAPTATDTAMATTAPAATQAATGTMAGTYEVTRADGTKVTETINADGTYVDVANGKETKGTWRMDGAKACFDEAGDVAEVCYTTSAPAADGSFQVSGPDGKVVSTVRKTGA